MSVCLDLPCVYFLLFGLDYFSRFTFGLIRVDLALQEGRAELQRPDDGLVQGPASALFRRAVLRRALLQFLPRRSGADFVQG